MSDHAAEEDEIAGMTSTNGKDVHDEEKSVGMKLEREEAVRNPARVGISQYDLVSGLNYDFGQEESGGEQRKSGLVGEEMDDATHKSYPSEHSGRMLLNDPNFAPMLPAASNGPEAQELGEVGKVGEVGEESLMKAAREMGGGVGVLSSSCLSLGTKKSSSASTFGASTLAGTTLGDSSCGVNTEDATKSHVASEDGSSLDDPPHPLPPHLAQRSLLDTHSEVIGPGDESAVPEPFGSSQSAAPTLQTALETVAQQAEDISSQHHQPVLVRTSLIEEQLIRKAERAKQRSILTIAIIALLIIAALAAGLTLGLNNHDTQDDFTESSTSTGITLTTTTAATVTTSTIATTVATTTVTTSNVVITDPTDPTQINCYPTEVYINLAYPQTLPNYQLEPLLIWSIKDSNYNLLSNRTLLISEVNQDINEDLVISNNLCLLEGKYFLTMDYNNQQTLQENVHIFIGVRGYKPKSNRSQETILFLNTIFTIDPKQNTGEISWEFQVREELISSSPSITPSSLIIPTIMPSKIPTKTPSITPTRIPMPISKSPTQNPTKNPVTISKSPTESPTKSPTLLTLGPTSNPSHFPTTPPTNSPIGPCHELNFELRTDRSGDEYQVSLFESLFSFPPTNFIFDQTGSEQNFSSRHCLPPSEYTFLIKDSGGNGICCNDEEGSYSLIVVDIDSNMGDVFNLLRRKGLFGRWEVLTFPLPFQTSSLHFLEVELSTDGPDPDGIQWEIRHNDNVVLRNLQTYENEPHIYHEAKYLPSGQYQMIVYDFQGKLIFLHTASFVEGGQMGDVIKFHQFKPDRAALQTTTFLLPFKKEEVSFLQIYFLTPHDNQGATWELILEGDGNDRLILQNSDYRLYESLPYWESIYLFHGQYKLIIHDNSGSGLYPSGGFRIYLNDKLLEEFWSSLSTTKWEYRNIDIFVPSNDN